LAGILRVIEKRREKREGEKEENSREKDKMGV
jgi:hypothetical protein